MAEYPQWSFKLPVYTNCLQGKPYIIDENINVISTAGHTSNDITVVVKDSHRGCVCIVGKILLQFILV